MAYSNNKQLTVAIPTYNRSKQLQKTLLRLLPQLDERCNLLILDNHSDTLVIEEIEHLLIKYPDVTYNVIRNGVNIGGDSNIIRCFEYCKTPWLWTLGDDDDITQDAIETIQKDILENPEVTHINYYSPHKFHPVRNQSVLAIGRKDFVSKADSLGASIFISSNIYNTTKLTKHWLANHNTYSCISQWLIIYYSLNKEGSVIYSHKIICYNNFKPTEYSNFVLSIAKGLATLLDIYTSKEEKKYIIRFLRTIDVEWITFEKIVKALLIDYMKSSKKLDIKFALKRFYNNLFKYFGFKSRFKYYFYSLFINLSPSISFKILRFIIIKRKNIDIVQHV